MIFMVQRNPNDCGAIYLGLYIFGLSEISQQLNG